MQFARMRDIRRRLGLVAYYGLARYLPSSAVSSASRRVRGAICRLVFPSAGRNINLDGLERVAGAKSFFWRGEYGFDLQTTQTNIVVDHNLVIQKRRDQCLDRG